MIQPSKEWAVLLYHRYGVPADGHDKNEIGLSVTGEKLPEAERND